METDEIRSRLRRYGFEANIDESDPDLLHVLVPPHRLWDAAFAADLYEELAKSVGYNNTPISLPPIEMGTLPSPFEARKALVEEILLANGFYEVVTDGFYGRETRERLGLDEHHRLWHHVETVNALDRNYSLLKNNALAQAVETIAKNVRMAHFEVKAYEWTRTFHPDDNNVCRERQLIWAISQGLDGRPSWAGNTRPIDVFTLKAMIGEIAVILGLKLRFGPPDPEYPLYSLLHPKRQAQVRLGDEVVGVIGEVHPRVVAAFKLKRARPCYFELAADIVEREHSRPPYVEPPAHHPIVRNLAFTLPKGVVAIDIAQHLKDSGPDWLEEVAITDQFDHLDKGQPVRTITFALSFANPNFDLTAEKTNAITEELIEAIHQRFSPKGVQLR